jgi:hypothetical protein
MTEETVGTLGGKSTRFGRRPLGASGRVIAAAMPVALWQDHQLVEVLRAVVDRRMRLRCYITAATAWLRKRGFS